MVGVPEVSASKKFFVLIELGDPAKFGGANDRPNGWTHPLEQIKRSFLP
jgi:hypothetical protein